ncbi:hypothetical protein B0O99DRAFT_589070 [Bisporella sp. PMI_857]|nr:hypothetical protein B0O99DRAFT_589070 [Bisporella sp. PMI_857]
MRFLGFAAAISSIIGLCEAQRGGLGFVATPDKPGWCKQDRCLKSLRDHPLEAKFIYKKVLNIPKILTRTATTYKKVCHQDNDQVHSTHDYSDSHLTYYEVFHAKGAHGGRRIISAATPDPGSRVGVAAEAKITQRAELEAREEFDPIDEEAFRSRPEFFKGCKIHMILLLRTATVTPISYKPTATAFSGDYKKKYRPRLNIKIDGTVVNDFATDDAKECCLLCKDRVNCVASSYGDSFFPDLFKISAIDTSKKCHLLEIEEGFTYFGSPRSPTCPGGVAQLDFGRPQPNGNVYQGPCGGSLDPY